jgi:gluconokinase
LIVIVMGVSGAGKTYLAERLAQATGWQYAEGDDFHSDANKAKMHAGIPLTDADREPWLASLHTLLAGWESAGVSGILTCSALRAVYREKLTAGFTQVRFVWLDPSRAVLEDHLAHRHGHYMSPALLSSQIATLEPPATSSDASQPGATLRLDGTPSASNAIAAILHWLGLPPAVHSL